MKKIFTLLIALGLFTIADAQRGNRGNSSNDGGVGVRISVNNNNGFQYNRFAADRYLRQEIARINLKYDHRIHRVQHSLLLFRYEKRAKIMRLNQQRQREINRVYTNARFNNGIYGNNHRSY